MMTVNKEIESVWVETSVSCFTLLDLTLKSGVEFWEPTLQSGTLLTVN